MLAAKVGGVAPLAVVAVEDVPSTGCDPGACPTTVQSTALTTVAKLAGQAELSASATTSERPIGVFASAASTAGWNEATGGFTPHDEVFTRTNAGADSFPSASTTVSATW